MSYESIVSTGIPEHPQVAVVVYFSMETFCKDKEKKQPHKQVLNSSKEKWDHSFGKTLLDPNYSGHQDRHDNNAQFKQEKDNRKVEMVQDENVPTTLNITFFNY